MDNKNEILPEWAQEILALANAATPGPWGGQHLGIDFTGGNVGHHGYGRQVQIWKADDKGPLVTDEIAVCCHGTHWQDEENAQFIAHARTDIPRLCVALATAIEALKTYHNSSQWRTAQAALQEIQERKK